jgi:hypothetical protein
MYGTIIKSRLVALDERITRLNVAEIIVVMLFLSYLSPLIADSVLYVLQTLLFGAPINHEHDFLGAKGLVSLAIAGCLIAPPLETLLLQCVPIRICQVSLHWSRTRSIIISALLFGALHYYSFGYAVWAFAAGLTLAYAFTVFDRKGSNSVLWVSILHAARNGVSLVYLIFKLKNHAL